MLLSISGFNYYYANIPVIIFLIRKLSFDSRIFKKFKELFSSRTRCNVINFTIIFMRFGIFVLNWFSLEEI